jgi:hypothetical protein
MLKDEVIVPLKSITFPKSEKSTLVVIQTEDYQNEVVQKTLAGIAKALGFSLENDFEIYLYEKNNPINLSASMINFKSVLVFGVNPKFLGLQIDAKVYKIFSFESFKLLIAHPLGTIANDIKTKQILWKILQSMYGLV